MDGRGRALDNIFVERHRLRVQYEEVYLKGYQTMGEAQKGLKPYLRFYNNARFHQALNYRTPREVYLSACLRVGRISLSSPIKMMALKSIILSFNFEQRGKVDKFLGGSCIIKNV